MHGTDADSLRPTHNLDTLRAHRKVLYRLIFEPATQRAITWGDDAQAALVAFDDAIDELAASRKFLDDAVHCGTGFQPVAPAQCGAGVPPVSSPDDPEIELTSLGESIADAAGQESAGVLDEQRAVEREADRYIRMSGRRGNALTAIGKCCSTLLGAAEFGGTATQHFLAAMEELCSDALRYDGLAYSVARQRPE